MLRLVSNKDSSKSLKSQPQKSIQPHKQGHFTATVHCKGPYLFQMLVQDPSHCLECELYLEVESRQEECVGGTVICHFPTIESDQLFEFTEYDDTLFGIIMIQFQMNILEQLLLFCANHYASRLVIFVDDDQADELDIFRDFLAYEDRTFTPQGEKTEMNIPADIETFDQWIEFAKKITTEFQQTLWRDQRFNSSIRRYLKNHALNPS